MDDLEFRLARLERLVALSLNFGSGPDVTSSGDLANQFAGDLTTLREDLDLGVMRDGTVVSRGTKR